MSKITWEFLIPQQEHDLRRAQNAKFYVSAIWNLYQDTRQKMKHCEDDTYAWKDIAKEVLHYLSDSIEKIEEIDSMVWMDEETEDGGC